MQPPGFTLFDRLACLENWFGASYSYIVYASPEANLFQIFEIKNSDHNTSNFFASSLASTRGPEPLL